jgi:hypothetical protein
MAENLQNTSKVDPNSLSKPALLTDLNSSFVSKEQYSFARNAVRNSKDGDIGTIGNEPSNLKCFSAPYTICGAVSLPDDTIMIFSGDGKNSEIGIGNELDCSYKKLLSLPCLNFNPKNPPVIGVAKTMFQKGTIVTFTDKVNPVRRIEIDRVSEIDSCDDILLFRKVKHPCIEIKKSENGTMPNGTYSVAIAYSLDNQVFTDWMSLTQRIQLFSETEQNALDIVIKDLDTSFEFYSIAVVGSYIDPATKGTTKAAKIIGTYSSEARSLTVTEFKASTGIAIDINSLVAKKTTWQKAGLISSNSNYLLLGDLVSRDEEDYQLKAMSIESEYIIEQVPLEYYEDGGNDIGYYADENYDFYIQGVYNTGELTQRYHIPGPVPDDNALTIVSGADIYEKDKRFKDCEDNRLYAKWEIENTAGILEKKGNRGFVCDRRILGTGKMGVFLSTELYPNNPKMFGQFANTPIRYHKFPDEAIVPRYSVVNGKYYINIKGVKFKKIPKFDNPEIVGYKITRSDRKNGNGTVIARGLMTNVRSYFDPGYKQNVMYSNYTVNDLNPDVYLSSKRVSFRNKSEKGYTPLSTFHLDRFNFYSPHTSFDPKYSLGQEIKIECEEIADVTGNFEKVHNHPRLKLLNQIAYWIAAVVGIIEMTLVLFGKNKEKVAADSGEITGGTNSGRTGNSRVESEFSLTGIEDLIGFDIAGYIQAQAASTASISGAANGASRLSRVIKKIKTILVVIAAATVKTGFAFVRGVAEANKVIDTIYNFCTFTDYVYQYNAKAVFNKTKRVRKGNRRRRLLRPFVYLPSDTIGIGNDIFNNFLREKSVYIQLNKEIPPATTVDNTRNTISGFGLCNNVGSAVSSVGSAFYVTSKAKNPNQYGSLGSSKTVSIHSCVLKFDEEEDLTNSPILYGGDCIITRFYFMKKMQFFTQNLSNANFPDGVEYNYQMYRNIGFPRYWLDSNRFEIAGFVVPQNVITEQRFLGSTDTKYNLDCRRSDDWSTIGRVSNSYMYLSNNCAVELIVECDYNINFRDIKTKEPFYSKDNKNLSNIFRSDRLKVDEEFKISNAYFDIYPTEVGSLQQRPDFDPENRVPSKQPNSVIYSLPSFNLQEVDNWQYFLPLNFFSFNTSDFGKLTSINKIDQDRLLFLFSKSSPYISMGRDFLQLDNTGRKITIGDGGLFAQDPREIMPTDDNFGLSTSRFAFSNTHMGRFYVSENPGRIMSFDQALNDISMSGIAFWCQNYMPIFLYKYFPSYPRIENPISGVGYQMVIDSKAETLYICKRDFSPVKEFAKDIVWSDKLNSFTYKSLKIELSDKNYFNDVSWTISYSLMDKSFVGWHDWHPNWVIQRDNNFLTVKGKSVWKHNHSYDSYCNFYGKDYPFEIEFVSSSGQQVETIRSIEYLLEVYKYKNFGRDRFHVFGENFDRLIVHNTEQISPLLNINKSSQNPEDNLEFPRKSSKNSVSYDILSFKEENKYRINHFWDTVKDRGEFNNSEFHLYPTDESGYKNVINPLAIDIDKPEEERKKFRHYYNKFRFIKTASGPNKFLVKLANIKKQVSLR